MKINFITTFVVTGILSLAACSVKQGAVGKNPPKIDEKAVSSYQIQYGRLVANVFSVLIWPNDWSEADWENNVKDVKINSGDLIKTMGRMSGRTIEAHALYRASLAQQCADKYGVSQAGDSADNIKVVWQDLPVVPAGDPGYNDYLAKQKELATCMAMQDKRLANIAENEDILNPKDKDGKPVPSIIAVLQQKIAEKLVNGKQLSAEQNKSFIQLKPSDEGMKVSIRLNNFANSGVDQSSEKGNGRIHDVAVDREGRHLSFTVPDLTEEGTEYFVDLYRSADLIPEFQDEDASGDLYTAAMAIYTGDVGMLKNGVLVGKGSAQIVGALVKPVE